MRKCINCKCNVRDNDIYCRNCGCYLQSNKSNVLINVITVFIVLGIIFMIVLFVASYILN